MPSLSKTEYKRQWYLRNKERLAAEKKTPGYRAKEKEWRKNSAAKRKAAWKAWSAAHPRSEDAKKWREKNPERYKMHTAKSNETTRLARVEDPRAAMIRAARKRASRRGFVCDLKIEDLFVPSHCPVLGIPLVVGAKTHHYGSPTLDRFDNKKGYTKDNTRVISYRANWIKGNATLEELTAVAEYVRSQPA
jgi:hypothetical protein